MILALIVLGVQVFAGKRALIADDEAFSKQNGFFDLTYGDEYTSLSIYPASAWHSSYIVPDNNYASEVSTISIYFRLDGEIDITTSYAEFIHPDAADFDDCILSKLNDGDWKAVCDISALDTAGVYGPISLVIRTSDSKQIIAEDVAYGYFALLGDEPNDGVLTISFASEEEEDAVYTVQEIVTLQFDVTIDVEMYFGDYFLLVVDERFVFDNLGFHWTDDVDGNNIFKETMVERHIDSDKIIYIYGFSGELTESATISFRLSGFSAPAVINPGGAYSFSLEVHRFGTNTLSKRYVGDGPFDSVLAGNVEIVSWAPVNTAIVAATDLHTGLVTWFKLIVKADHDVPANGEIKFALTGVILNSYTFESDNNQEKVAAGTVGILTENKGLSCEADELEITCTASRIITARTSIVVYNLIEITGNLVISSVTTKSPTATIDENTTGKTIFLPDTGNALTTSYARIAMSTDSDTGVNRIMLNDANYGILVGFKFPAQFTGGTDSFNIHLPFTTGEASDNTKLVIRSSASVKKVDIADAITYADSSELDSAVVVNQALGKNQITVAVASSGTNIAANRYFYAFIGSTTLGTNKLHLPKIPTQMSQMAEIVLKMKISMEYYLYASPFYFQKATLAIAPSIALACTNAVVGGMPATLTYTPDAYTAPDRYSLKVQLTVANVNFLTGSGLSVGDIFPGSSKAYKVADNGSLYIDGLTSLTENSISINVPLPVLAAGTILSLQANVYLLSTSGSNILLYSETSENVEITDAVSTAVFTIPDSITIAVDASYDLDVTLATGYNDATDPTYEEQAVFFILLFPYGYSTTDPDFDVRLAPKNSMFPFIYAYKSIDAADYFEDVGGGTKTISITVPWFEGTTNVNLFSGKGSLSTFTGVACDQDSIAITTDSAASLTFGSYSPATVKGYTYSNPDVDVYLILTSTRAIVSGTTFVSTLNYWIGCTATYTISGKTENPTTVAYPANTAITIKLTGCALPSIAAGEDLITDNGFTSITGSYDSNIYLRWTEPDTKTQTVISSNTDISGMVSDATLWAFPNVVGAVDAYFVISFTLDANIPLIPAGSSIEIDGDFSDDADLLNNLWTNFKYSSASISKGKLTLVNTNEILAKSTLKVVKDLAFDIADDTPEAVLVTVTTRDVDIILDVSTTQKYSVQAEPAGKISFAIKVSEKNAGFVSEYEFTIKFDSASEAERVWVHLDATKYNAIVGPTIFFRDLPDIPFLFAFNAEGDFILCFTNHWVTSCGFEGPIEQDDVLKFSIWIENAVEEGSWSIFVTNDELVYLYQPAYSNLELSFTNDLSNDIDLYFAEVDFSEYEDHYMHDLVLSAFVNIEATSGSKFTVQFPSPYDFTEYPSDTIVCGIIYHHFDNNDEVEEIPILKDAECSIMNGMVTFTLTDDQTFTTDFWTHFTIYDVLTPVQMYEGRESEHEYNPYLKMFYSENFRILYSTVPDGYVSASFDNLNAAFAGFFQGGLEALVVNDGNPLHVTPGTWSGDYAITNLEGEFQAESVEITWKTEDFIELDEESYILDYKFNWAWFLIGVASDEEIVSGIYVIEWEIVETPFDGLHSRYARPRNSLVEISRELVTPVALFEPNIFVPTNGWSMPIIIFYDLRSENFRYSFPYDSIEIKFEENDLLDLSFRPNPVVLSMDSYPIFFSIQCLKCVAGGDYTFFAKVEGKNSEAYVMKPESYVFRAGTRYNTPATFSIKIKHLLASEFKFNIKTNQIGLATWALISEQSYYEDPNRASYEYIIENSFILGAAQNTKDDLETLKKKHNSRIRELNKTYKDYEELTKKKLSHSRNIYYSAQEIITIEGTILISFFTALAPKTNYFVYLYFDNFDGNGPVQAIKKVTTPRTPSHARLSFEWTQDHTKHEFLASLKRILKLPEANYNLNGANFNRRLANLNTVVIYSDTSTSRSAYDYAIVNRYDIEFLTSRSTLEITEIADDEEAAEFEGNSTWVTDNGNYLIFKFSSNVNGYVYCATEINGTELTSDQVYEGVNANGDEIYQLAGTVNHGYNNLIWNFTDAEISPFGTYHVNCIVCNYFPGIPDCSKVQNQEYEYTGENDNSDELSGAEPLVVAFAAYLLF